MTTVLVIDDEPLLRDYMRGILEREGFEVVDAVDGDDGLRKFEQGDVDILITDLVMPNRDGLELIKELCGRKPELGVIAISGGGRPAGCFLIPAKAMGAQRTLSKPFKRVELIEAVNDVMNELSFA